MPPAHSANSSRYTPFLQLGKGGMAAVYLAAMRAAHGATKLVVVKELLPDLVPDPEFRTMFVDEARLGTRLSHPNVVNIFEVLDDGDGRCSIVMEYLEGQPLSRVRHALRASPLWLPLQLAIIVDVLNGLNYAHELKGYDGAPMNIVHRDISPQNVFVNYTGDVKIVDFGIAKANDSLAETRAGVIKGKVAYMAPEQALGMKIDRRADIFSVGVMMFEALVGARMWNGMNEAAIIHRLTTSDIPKPSAVKPGLPSALDAVCQKALAPNPDERFATAAEFIAELELAAAGLPSRRAIGEAVSGVFAAERENIARVIEERLGSMKSTSSGDYAPLSEPPKVVTFAHGTLSEEHPRPMPAVESGTFTAKGSALIGSAARSRQPAKARRAPLVLVGVVVAAVSLGGSFAALRFTRARSVAKASEAHTTAGSALARQIPAKSTLTLKVTPANAKLSVDGSELPAGTTKLEGSIDAQRRTLHVETPGYQPRDVVLSFVVDTTLEIALDPVATAPTAGRISGKPRSKPDANPTAKPTSTEPDIGY